MLSHKRKCSPARTKQKVLYWLTMYVVTLFRFSFLINSKCQMGLGKTITCVSLIAGTLQSSLDFANAPLDPVQPLPPPPDAPHASHFSGSVWGMPEAPENNTQMSSKAKAKAERAREKLEAEYARACRIKAKSRATLIICPLSTVSNWEDQFREHWKGEVFVVGGNGGVCSVPSAPSSSQASSSSQSMAVVDEKKDIGKTARVREGRALRVYIYHGNARRPDPSFLADFDAVITTYATLASEYSKQNRSLASAEEEEEDGEASDQGGVDYDDRGNPVVRLPKPKKTGTKRKKTALTTANNPAEIPSALQSIHWFRVVLDEAQ